MADNKKVPFMNARFVEDCEFFKQEDEMERIQLEQKNQFQNQFQHRFQKQNQNKIPKKPYKSILKKSTFQMGGSLDK